MCYGSCRRFLRILPVVKSKYLSQQTEQLDIIARDAYQMLFDDELPVIVETNVTSRTVETLEAPLQ